ncbi:MAG: hypothetical protein ACOC00_07680 [Halothiobacillaceae bacterium]
MADVIDTAQERIEAALADSIESARHAAPAAPYLGRCLYCGERTDTDRRWCNAECRDLWERAK